MTEDSQLKAVEAELVAGGYQVSRDVAGERLRDLGIETALPDGLALDFVAKKRPGRTDDKDSRRILVVEIANRSRRTLDPDRPSRRRPPREFLDEEAVERFDAIAAGLSEVPAVEFQIRFLDVSSDQGRARRLSAPVRRKGAMGKRLVEDRQLLGRSSNRDGLSHALVVVRLWAYWLRVMGYRYPGRERREMKQADLRTLQKDLYDSDVLDMGPDLYRTVHRIILAATEGGDFEPSLIGDL